MDEIADQDGVVARRQLIAAGLGDHDIRRLIRRRELVPMGRGVYVVHTGDPTWLQRAWAAVLAVGSAALCDVSALRLTEGPGRGWDESVIHVAVATERTVVAPPSVVVHRQADLGSRVAWHSRPPRLNFDEAIIDVAQRQTKDIDVVAVLATAVGSRRTTAQRLRAALGRRAKAHRRTWLDRVLDDIASGTWSVLEHGYLDLVERAHGLQPGMRQVRHVGATGAQYRDVQVAGLVIELDGWAFHSSRRQHDVDLERDLDAAVAGQSTIRLGFGQVFDHPCRTAAKVGAVLTRLGWTGSVSSCGSACRATAPN